jgi:hypothetical protein
MSAREQELLALITKYESALWRMGINPKQLLGFIKDENAFPLDTWDDYYQPSCILQDAEEFFEDEQFSTKAEAINWVKTSAPVGVWVINHVWLPDGEIIVPVAEIKVDTK